MIILDFHTKSKKSNDEVKQSKHILYSESILIRLTVKDKERIMQNLTDNANNVKQA